MSFPASTGTGRGDQTVLVTGNGLRAGLFGILRFQRRGIRRLAEAFLRHGGRRESIREVVSPAKRHPRGRFPRQEASARSFPPPRGIREVVSPAKRHPRGRLPRQEASARSFTPPRGIREVVSPAKRHPRGRNPRQEASTREIMISRSGPYLGGPAPEGATQHEDAQREHRHEDESDPERGDIRDHSHKRW
jgi:hypothetical protein